jgi:hypothetical protein
VEQFIYYLFFFFLAFDFFSSRRRTQFLILLLGLEVFFLIGLGFYQEMGSWSREFKMYGLLDMSHYSIFFSSFINPNHYGGFLVMASFFFLGWLLYSVESGSFHFEKSREFVEGIFLATLLPLTVISIYYASARAALAFELLAIFAFILIALSPSARKRVLLGFLALVAFFAAVIRFSAVDIKIQNYENLIDELFWRIFGIQADSLAIARDHLLFGTGLGTFKYIISLYQTKLVEVNAWFRPFNHYLELLTDTGLVGFTLFMLPMLLLVLFLLSGT